MPPYAVRWHEGLLRILDQTSLPGRVRWLYLKDELDVREAICNLRVRGAPAIGLAGAYGICLAASRHAQGGTAVSDLLASLQQAHQLLESARPTAVNLAWALNRMKGVWTSILQT